MAPGPKHGKAPRQRAAGGRDLERRTPRVAAESFQGLGIRHQGSWEEKRAITLCLWQRLRASSKHVVELAELALGICSATHVSSKVIKW